MQFNWSSEKNEELKKERNISFEEIILAIEDDNLVDILEHPNQESYPNQILFLVKISNYIYAVPTVVDEKKKEYFLKTIYPSRKYTNLYIEGESK